MKVLIMGCGRTGAYLAGLLDADRHEVTILDIDAYSFRRLMPSFGGTALVGNGTDEEDLKQAGIEKADAFIALAVGDNRNIMASQIAKNVFSVPRVICRIYDPQRQDIFSALGLEAFSPTTILAQIVREKLEG